LIRFVAGTAPVQAAGVPTDACAESSGSLADALVRPRCRRAFRIDRHAHAMSAELRARGSALLPVCSPT
jgi:hypothetical protein